MPKKNLSEIVCIIDRSGSMDYIKNDAIGGFNTFLEGQKAFPGEAKFTLVMFDHEYLVPYNGVDIQSVPPFNGETYVPRGTTALLDAIGRTITTVGERLSNTPEEERPEKVIVSILTDGLENASQEYKRKKIHEMITHQRETYSWEFIFLAANQDAIKEGASIGISKLDSFNFVPTGAGIRASYGMMGQSVTAYRTGTDTGDQLWKDSAKEEEKTT